MIQGYKSKNQVGSGLKIKKILTQREHIRKGNKKLLMKRKTLVKDYRLYIKKVNLYIM